MAYMCVLATNHECNGCQECEEEHTSKEDAMRWDRWDYEYDNYRDSAREEDRNDR